MFFKEVNGQRRYMTGNSINSQLRARRGEDPTTITELSTLVNDPRTFVMLEARSGVYLKNTRTGGYIALDYSEPGSVPYPAILVGREEQASAIHSSL
ncbi:hypothetical protein [Microbulbifer spongiae]|uniref:Uncharacterized protein n=1 Tax=Microbulbifer spongiae TaxID=2944933 RepID=A0ABY9EAI1_9GAMM|nr:hypothetical protein [Microbulbifer sp. MI-G]WKD49098.1 hypothetical protein M8T91_14525 [Microbulbifer sp. MI-G]